MSFGVRAFTLIAVAGALLAFYPELVRGLEKMVVRSQSGIRASPLDFEKVTNQPNEALQRTGLQAPVSDCA
jgi:hypothetical protein